MHVNASLPPEPAGTGQLALNPGTLRSAGIQQARQHRASPRPTEQPVALGGSPATCHCPESRIKSFSMAFTDRDERGRVSVVRVGIRALAGKDVLVGKDQGAAAATAVGAFIEREVASLQPGTPIELDFDGVEAITVPFARECFGRLLGSRAGGLWTEYPFCVINANEDVRSTVAAALAPNDLFVLSFGERIELLGGSAALSQTVETALEAANPAGQFSVNDLATRLDVSVQAVNNRLKPLLRNGVLSRTQTIPSGGGREFVYRVARRSSPATT